MLFKLFRHHGLRINNASDFGKSFNALLDECNTASKHLKTTFREKFLSDIAQSKDCLEIMTDLLAKVSGLDTDGRDSLGIQFSETYKCDTCKKEVSHNTDGYVIELPSTDYLQKDIDVECLKRFSSIAPCSCPQSRWNMKVTPPLFLHVAVNRVSQAGEKTTEKIHFNRNMNFFGATYELVALASHKGQNGHQGHFVCRVRDPDHSWFYADTDRVCKNKFPNDSSDAFLFVYKRMKTSKAAQTKKAATSKKVKPSKPTETTSTS